MKVCKNCFPSTSKQYIQIFQMYIISVVYVF